MKKSIFDSTSNWSDETGELRNEIVFERLNKTYGAYEIRTHYDQTVRRAMAGLTLFIGFLSVVLLSFRPAPVEEQAPPIYDSTILTSYEEKDWFDEPKEPESTPASPASASDDYVPEITTDSVILPDTSALLALNTGPVNGHGVDTGLVSISPGGNGTNLILDNPPADTNLFPYGAIQENPRFPGGDEAMYAYLSKNLVYPEPLREIKVGGKVAVQFIINKRGKVVDVKVISASKYQEFNREALRVIKSMPDWEPGKQNGLPVRVQLVLPINFVTK